jgi:effector-binding domain-containing protein
MPRKAIAKRSILIAIYYQYDFENSERNYERLVELAVEKEITIYLKAACNENSLN